MNRSQSNYNQDCSNIKRDLDCLERNSKTLCASCRRYDREERFKDLQTELDDHMEDLSEVEFDAGQTGNEPDRLVGDHIDVAGLFAEMVELKFGDDFELVKMTSVRIPQLRRLANFASRFGLDMLADIVRRHISLRRAA